MHTSDFFEYCYNSCQHSLPRSYHFNKFETEKRKVLGLIYINWLSPIEMKQYTYSRRQWQILCCVARCALDFSSGRFIPETEVGDRCVT